MIRGYQNALLLTLLLVTSSLFCGTARATSWPASYQDAGVANPDRAWTGADYERAVAAIVAEKVPLPTFHDSNGKALLKRLVAVENLNFIQNQDVPVISRFDDFQLIQSSLRTLLGHYVKIANQGKVQLPDELTAFYCFMLRTAAGGIGLTDYYLAALPKDDRYDSRIAGLKKTQVEILDMLVGAEMSLNEKYYSKRNRNDLLLAISDTLPRFKPLLPPDFKIEYRVKLIRQRDQFKDKKNLLRLKQMTELLAS